MNDWVNEQGHIFKVNGIKSQAIYLLLLFPYFKQQATVQCLKTLFVNLCYSRFLISKLLEHILHTFGNNCAISRPLTLPYALIKNMKLSLLVSLASTVTLCQAAVSRSKDLATVIVPLFGSILKAFVVSLLLSTEYLEEKSWRHTI